MRGGVDMLVHAFRPDVSLPAKRFAKRLFDVVVSAALLLIVFPVMVLFALLIRLESAGSVFCRQLRIGEHGQPFALLTFRTTYAGTDRQDDGQDSGQHTRTGRILSQYGLDALPQLINVLRGDMSCVGPQPKRFARFARPSDSDMAIPAFQHRHAVKPGITGWAQVQDTHGTIREQARNELKYDLKYVDQHSLLFDIWILAQTIRLVFTGQGSRQRH
jgi:lipopolysaccharide/colanic/teichoic acid biosynthesis glycosyltransferase